MVVGIARKVWQTLLGEKSWEFRRQRLKREQLGVGTSRTGAIPVDQPLENARPEEFDALLCRGVMNAFIDKMMKSSPEM